MKTDKDEVRTLLPKQLVTATGITIMSYSLWVKIDKKISRQRKIMINVPRRWQISALTKTAGSAFFGRLLSIPDIDWQRKLAANEGHPLHCVPACWPSHATLDSDWFDTLNTNTCTYNSIKSILLSPQGNTLFLMFSPLLTLLLLPWKVNEHRLFLFSIPSC